MNHVTYHRLVLVRPSIATFKATRETASIGTLAFYIPARIKCSISTVNAVVMQYIPVRLLRPQNWKLISIKLGPGVSNQTITKLKTAEYIYILFSIASRGPSSLPSSRYRGLYPVWSGRGVKLTTHLHLVPRSRMLEIYLHSLLCFFKHRDNFTFTT
jgi:hypothetical protein